MTDLLITKDDIGKVFKRKDRGSETVLEFDENDQEFPVLMESGYYYSSSGKADRGGSDLIKRKEETMWVKTNRRNPLLLNDTIIEIKRECGNREVSYARNIYNWSNIIEYRIVEAAPEEKRTDFINYYGGTQPVEDDTEIEVKLRCGGDHIFKFKGRTAPWFDKASGVMAYRIAKEKPDPVRTTEMKLDSRVISVTSTTVYANPSLIKYWRMGDKPKTKRYELKDMWKVWGQHKDSGEMWMGVYTTLEKAKKAVSLACSEWETLAITRGDSQGFCEGEGL